MKDGKNYANMVYFVVCFASVLPKIHTFQKYDIGH